MRLQPALLPSSHASGVRGRKRSRQTSTTVLLSSLILYFPPGFTRPMTSAGIWSPAVSRSTGVCGSYLSLQRLHIGARYTGAAFRKGVEVARDAYFLSVQMIVDP